MNQLHRWYCRSNHWRQKLDTEILPRSLKAADLHGEVLELGPGPGLTTDWLRSRCRQITCLELDDQLAGALSRRLADTNVTVRVGDATAMPFQDGMFALVLSFTMLHHLPSSTLQDRLFAEAYRVLKRGGVFVGSDSMWSFWMQLFHFADTMVTVDPDRLPSRLQAAGFDHVDIQKTGRRFSFSAIHPASDAYCNSRHTGKRLSGRHCDVQV